MTLRELLDNVGWSQREENAESYEWKDNVFKWMTEATIRIEELDNRTVEIARLTGKILDLQESNLRNIELLLKAVKGK